MKLSILYIIVFTFLCSFQQGYTQIIMEHDISTKRDTSNYPFKRNLIKSYYNFYLDDTTDVESLITVAIYQSQIEEFDNAIATYTKIAEFYPEQNDAITNRAFCYLNSKKYDNALADFTKAIEIESDDPVAYLNRAHYWGEIEQWEKSKMDLDKAIELNPKYIKAYGNRGFSKMELGLYEGAIKDYNKALELKPYYFIAMIGRGDSYLKNEDYENALNDYNSALEYSGTVIISIFYIKLGEAKLNTKDSAGAEDSFIKALDLSEDSTEYFYNKSLISFIKKDYNKAFVEINKAIEIGEQIHLLYKQRAKVYTKLGDKGNAKLDMEKSKRKY